MPGAYVWLNVYARTWDLMCMAIKWTDCTWRVYGTHCVLLVYGA